jgi:hypothetical protein
MKLNNALAKEAKKHGICEDWYLELKNENNIDSMLDMYVKGIDFCLSNDYPSNDFIRKNFKGKMETHGIHLDEMLNIVSQPKVIALGNCFGTVETNDFEACEIYLKHNSEIVVMASRNSFVMIDIFDDSKLTVFAYDNSKVCINRYGGQVIQTANQNASIKIIEKNQKTY